VSDGSALGKSLCLFFSGEEHRGRNRSVRQRVSSSSLAVSHMLKVRNFDRGISSAAICEKERLNSEFVARPVIGQHG
jgi:hypothetical protein